jgi:hypothetical protein
MNIKFEIKILEQAWIDDKAENVDLCSHGRISLIIGDTQIVNNNERYAISTSALAMLRTIESNHSEDDPIADRMIFHGCGIILMKSCPIGVDWKIQHLEGNIVQISDIVWYPETNKKVQYPDICIKLHLSEYSSQIVSFAKKAKDFFLNIKKQITDKYDKKQYEEFWTEYDKLLGKYS